MSVEQFMGLHGELVQDKYNSQTGVCVCACVCVYTRTYQFPGSLASTSLRIFRNAGRDVAALRVKS